MDMLTAGIHGTLTLKKERTGQSKQINKITNQNRKSVEIGTSIKFCAYPFTKTRVIRFTKRFQVINTLSYPVVLQEPKHVGS
jgi:SHR-binding domain of vacuolar-sorting associated protein 13